MAEEKYTDLTNAVYKILEFFPEEELLKNKAKDKALEIMENLVLVSLPDNPHANLTQKGKVASQTLKDIEILKSYLVLAKERGWIDKMNLMILLKEYDKVKEEIKPVAELINEEKAEKIPAPAEQKTAEIPVDNNVNKNIGTYDVPIISERQKKILEILQGQEKAQVADFKKIMPEVSKRTLRRDLDDLLKKQKVTRAGEWNHVFYQIFRSQTSENEEALPMDQNSQNNTDEDRTLLMS